MEIILKEDIIGLGYKNEIVNVKSGYGRNYLIPTGKGVIASDSAKKVLAENLKQQAHKLAAQKAAAEKRAEALKNIELVIPMKVSANGVTYGSVNAGIVAAELAKKGMDIDRKIITMHDVKKLGDFEATVHFYKDVEVKVPVKVVAEEEETPAEPQAEATETAPKAEVAPAAENVAEDVKEEPAAEAEAPETVQETAQTEEPAAETEAPKAE